MRLLTLVFNISLLMGLILLVAPPISAGVVVSIENRASASAARLTALIGIETRLSDEAAWENFSSGYTPSARPAPRDVVA